MPRMLDLFSGLGGASEAFVQHPDWEVVRVEVEPLLADVPCTRRMNALDFLKSDLVGYYDLIWASPPCIEFSTAFNAPGPKAQRAGEEFAPDLSLVRCAKAVIDCLEPKWGIIENVRGAIPHLTPILGSPAVILGPFILWGSIPTLDLDRGFKHAKFGPGSNDTTSGHPLRSQHNAQVPIEISRALLDGVTNQRTLDEF